MTDQPTSNQQVSTSISLPPEALVVTTAGGEDYLRIAHDGTVTGLLATEHPEAVIAFSKLGTRINEVMIR